MKSNKKARILDHNASPLKRMCACIVITEFHYGTRCNGVRCTGERGYLIRNTVIRERKLLLGNVDWPDQVHLGNMEANTNEELINFQIITYMPVAVIWNAVFFINFSKAFNAGISLEQIALLKEELLHSTERRFGEKNYSNLVFFK